MKNYRPGHDASDDVTHRGPGSRTSTTSATPIAMKNANANATSSLRIRTQADETARGARARCSPASRTSTRDVTIAASPDERAAHGNDQSREAPPRVHPIRGDFRARDWSTGDTYALAETISSTIALAVRCLETDASIRPSACRARYAYGQAQRDPPPTLAHRASATTDVP